MQPSPVVCLAVHGLFELFGFGFIFFFYSAFFVCTSTASGPAHIGCAHTHTHTQQLLFRSGVSFARICKDRPQPLTL